MTSPVFIVGTGRCGSTMISEMLNKHPDVLSISELFSVITDLATLNPQAFPEGMIDASQFWSILSDPRHKGNLLIQYGLASNDPILADIITRPRFRAGIPPIMTTLRRITRSDLEPLFDEMHVFVASQPSAPVQQHYLRLFAWMVQKFERKKWVERSVRLQLVPYLRQTFPDARFIHIVRDGRDTAISLSKHPGFRLLQVVFQFVEKLGIDPFESQDRSRIEELSDELRLLLPESFNASVFRNYHLPLSYYGYYWSQEIIKGLQILGKMPPQQVLTTRYEDILKEPEASVRKLITFIDPDLVDEDWISDIVPTVKSGRSSWKALPPEEQEQLNEACLSGFAALEAFQVSWEKL